MYYGIETGLEVLINKTCGKGYPGCCVKINGSCVCKLSGRALLQLKALIRCGPPLPPPKKKATWQERNDVLTDSRSDPV